MEKQQQTFKLFEQEDELNNGLNKAVDNSAPDPHASEIKKHSADKLLKIRQFLISWLLQQKPTGIGVKVPTRISRYQADIAAFWSVPNNKLLIPRQTMIIELRHDREACWPDCADKNKLLNLLRDAKTVKTQLEKVIQQEEPELADSNVLFDEFRGWNYHKSRNSFYHQACAKLEKIEHALYKGSRFEMIRTAQVADLLYLAVPEKTISVDEVADGWGLLYFDKQGKVTEIKSPENWNCSLEKRQHLIQNIATANTNDTLFRNGIRYAKDNTVSLTKAPRRRRSAT